MFSQLPLTFTASSIYQLLKISTINTDGSPGTCIGSPWMWVTVLWLRVIHWIASSWKSAITSIDVVRKSVDIGLAYWKWRRWLPSANRGLWPNTFSLTTYYVNCSLMFRVCNVWQFRHYLFFSFLFSLYLLYLFFSCLLPINLVNKVDYNVHHDRKFVMWL